MLLVQAFKNGRLDSCEENALMIAITLWSINDLQSADVKSLAQLGSLGSTDEYVQKLSWSEEKWFTQRTDSSLGKVMEKGHNIWWYDGLMGMSLCERICFLQI